MKGVGVAKKTKIPELMVASHLNPSPQATRTCRNVGTCAMKAVLRVPKQPGNDAEEP